MPLPPAIEFLAAQEDKAGAKLCHFGVSQVIATLPADYTVVFTVRPRSGIYANYTFRSILDPTMVPGAFRVEVLQFGAAVYWATVYPGILGPQHDYFLRVTQAQPIINHVTNLTNINQRFISYDQSLVVASEEEFRELERRLELYFGQVEETNRLLRELVQISTLPPRPVTQPRVPPTPVTPPGPRRIT